MDVNIMIMFGNLYTDDKNYLFTVCTKKFDSFLNSAFLYLWIRSVIARLFPPFKETGSQDEYFLMDYSIQ